MLNVTISAQSNISGKVIDGLSKEPLPFVTIFFNLERTKGTRADINGKFVVHPQRVDSLFFSYVGYEKKAIKVP